MYKTLFILASVSLLFCSCASNQGGGTTQTRKMQPTGGNGQCGSPSCEKPCKCAGSCSCR